MATRTVGMALLALGCALLQLTGVAAAAALALESPKVALSAGPLQFAILATPKQPALKHVTLDALVDTTGTTLVSELVRLALRRDAGGWSAAD
jgi:hypothetical protein